MPEVVRRAVSAEILASEDSDAVAAICHKLRTPLTAAMGFVQLALREERDSPREGQLSTLEMVDQQLRRISSLIDELALRARV
jgi:signal transduction histidine kinase